MSISRRGRKKKRGSILLLSLFFLIVLFSLSVAFFRIIPAEFHSASASRARIQANYAADSGGHHAVNWIKYRMKENGSSVITDAQVESYNRTNFGSHRVDFDSGDWPELSASDSKLVEHRLDGEWSFLSRIRLDDTDYFRRIYTIESCAYLRGKPQRVVKMTVQNESFAKYALYYSQWDENNIYAMGPNGIQGPVHTNDFLRVSAAGGTSFWNATKGDGSPEDPWVSGPLARITHAGAFAADSTAPTNTMGIAGDGLQYANGNSYQRNLEYLPYDDSGNPIASRYEKIVTNGRDNIKQIGEIEMPEQNADLRDSAWGSSGAPSNSSEWNSALDGDEGYMTVMTDSGKVNDPSGKVEGGIFIGRRDVNEFLLDITPEGHQKTRIRQGSLRVNTPNSTSIRANLPKYRKQITHPAYTTTSTVCDRWNTRQVPNWVRVTRTRNVTRQNGSRCGYTTVYIDGDNGVGTPVQVANTCTYEETYREWVQDGTRTERTTCAEERIVITDVPERTEWINDVPSTDTGAVFWRNETETITQTELDEIILNDPSFNDYETVQNSHNIQRWNSVVEVNDSDYQIPYYSGMKINGQTITDPNDPALTVGDGYTVKIENDYSDRHGNYAEYTVMEGRINGITFSDRHLWNVRGTVKGSKYDNGSGAPEYHGRLLATNVAAGRDLEIQDSILQYYAGSDVDEAGNPLNDGRNRLAVGNTSPNGNHILGLIAEDIWVDAAGDRPKDRENRDTARRERNFNGGHFQGGINVYAVMMAGRMHRGREVGGFGVRNDNMNRSWRGMGDFNLYGGLISAKSRQTQNTQLNAGYRLSLNYDPIAAEQMQNFSSTDVFSPLRYVTYQP